MIRSKLVKPASGYHVVNRDGRFKVFDHNQHYRCDFVTLAEAEAYIAAHTGSHAQARAKTKQEPA